MADNQDVTTSRSLLDAVVGNFQELISKDGTFELEIRLKFTGTPAVSGTDVASEANSDEGGFETAFNSEGHHVIALIAQKDLEVRAPTILEKVQAVLDTVPNGGRTILEAATFPDDIRAQQPQTKTWHFIDIPFEEAGAVNPPLPEAPHVLSKIKEFTDLLQQNNRTASEKADAVSWLFHLFGDVHQPLHCIEHISDLHPAGDRGGNSFRLKGPKNNLHSLWDSSVNILQHKTEDELSNAILLEHTRESLETDLAVTDPEKWARISFNLAKQHAYALTENPQNPPKPSLSYLKNMEEVGHRQAALGGYRLADRLIEIFG